MSKPSRSVLMRLPKLMGIYFWLYMATALGFSLVNFGLQLGVAQAMRHVFDAATFGDAALLTRGIQTLMITFAVFLVPFPVVFYAFSVTAAQITGLIRQRLFGHIQRLPIAYFKDQHSADLVSRLTNDIVTLENGYTDTLFGFIMGLIGGIGALAYLLYLDWRLAVVSIIIGVLGMAINSYFAKQLRQLGQKIQNQLATVTTKLSDLLAGMHIIRTYNLDKRMVLAFGKENDTALALGLKRVRVNSALGAFNWVLGSLSAVGLIIFGGFLYFAGAITIGVIIAAIQMQQLVSNFFGSLGQTITEMQASLAGADRIFEVLDTPIEPDAYRPEVLLPGPDGLEVPYLGCVNVTFAYEDGEEDVLNKLTLTLNKGQVGALAGPSGGGKSTIFKLLLGFYPTHDGIVYINGAPLDQQHLVQAREHIAFVPQDAFLFAGTIRENIAYGRSTAAEDEVIAAAKVANAHDFIMALEEGYDTQVGERGSQLSGGERQRIAIARAVLKNAPILLLDEATSSLDTESERLVQDALQKLMVGRTTLVIAHRLSTIETADTIMVIAQGKVQESGTHEELLKQCGLFSQLYNQQFITKNDGNLPHTGS